MDLVEALQRAGAHVFAATTLDDALTLVESPALSAAIVDHALHNGDSSRLCQRLNERGLPFLIYTGVGKLGGPCAAGGHISKPQHPDILVALLARLLFDSELEKSRRAAGGSGGSGSAPAATGS